MADHAAHLAAAIAGAEAYFGDAVAVCLAVPSAAEARALAALASTGTRDPRRVLAVVPGEVVKVPPATWNRLHGRLGGAGKVAAWALARAVGEVATRYRADGQTAADAAVLSSASEALSFSRPVGRSALERLILAPDDPSVWAATLVAQATWLERLRALARRTGLDLPEDEAQEEERARVILAERGLSGLGEVAKLGLPLTARLSDPLR